MRVRRRKKAPPKSASEGTVSVSGSHSDAASQQGDGYEYKVEILGTVNSTVKFEGLCEFQYLPVAKKDDGSYENLLDKLQLKQFVPQDEYLARDAPLFIPPVVSSRFDFPQKYSFMVDRSKVTEGDSLNTAETLAPGRKARARYTTFISFTDPTPSEPKEATKKHAENFKSTGLQERLQQLFEQRPVWSKAALQYHMRDNVYCQRHLKEVLAAVAYIFLTGPWRTFWVRFGYDPRKDPASKKYQGVDVRRRQRGLADDLKIIAKRSTEKPLLPGRNTGMPPEINLSLARGEEDEGYEEPKLRDFEFHPDVLPPHRQIVYSICDIYDDEVQNMLAKNDGKETTCDERDGWGVSGFTEFCRSVLTKHVNKLCPTYGKIHLKKNAKRQKITTYEDSEDNEGNDSMDASEYY